MPGRRSSNCRLSSSDRDIKNNIYSHKIAKLLKRVNKLNSIFITKIIRFFIPLKYSRLVSKGSRGDKRKYKSRYIAKGKGSKAGDFGYMSKKINITIYNIIK
jgi:hypothetical protein